MLPPTSGAPGGASLAQILASHSTVPAVQSTPLVMPAKPATSGPQEVRNDVELKAASLKMYFRTRPNLRFSANFVAQTATSPYVEALPSSPKSMLELWQEILTYGGR